MQVNQPSFWLAIGMTFLGYHLFRMSCRSYFMKPRGTSHLFAIGKAGCSQVLLSTWVKISLLIRYFIIDGSPPYVLYSIIAIISTYYNLSYWLEVFVFINLVLIKCPLSPPKKTPPEKNSRPGNPRPTTTKRNEANGFRPHFELLEMIGAVEFEAGNEAFWERGRRAVSTGFVLVEGILVKLICIDINVYEYM